ncbi:MAG TPA: hypothetical protein DDW20_05620 [Firmicutes bacterium]|nr:hypothetical protein [Bacillota bacterium]
MKVKVYQSETDEYTELELLGKLKYVGESFGVDGLTNNKIYDCVGMSSDGKMLSIVDDSEENYMYSFSNPRPADGSSKGGIWEIYEIYDEKLKKLLSTQK